LPGVLLSCHPSLRFSPFLPLIHYYVGLAFTNNSFLQLDMTSNLLSQTTFAGFPCLHFSKPKKNIERKIYWISSGVKETIDFLVTKYESYIPYKVIQTPSGLILEFPLPFYFPFE
jgi:hypothetical protein